MAKRKDTDYLFASSRIRALEKGLLNKERIHRMLESRSLEESIKVLQECNYGLEQDLAPGHYEDLLTQEHQKNLALIRELDEKLGPLFSYQYDYLNIKILLKAEFLGLEEAIFSPLGDIPVAKLKVAIRERNFAGMTPVMREAAAKAIDAFGKSGDPQSIDLILDAACFEDMKKKAKEFDNPYINDFVAREIDLANIKAFVRIKKQGGRSELLRYSFIPGGKLDLNAFLPHLDEDWDSIGQATAYTDYGNTLLEALPAAAAGELGTFEKLLDDHRIEKLKPAKLIAFGVEPLVAFMAAKENDIKIARIILTGKAADLPSERIAEKVRETYV